MESFTIEFIKPLFQITLLLGAILVSIWFYFRLKKSQAPPAPSSGKDDLKLLLSLKLQACERLILFLERIAPNNLILRVHTSDMSAPQLQAALIRAIREEFEYNLSQQLYVSTGTWEMIRNAKEETMRQVNAAASTLKENATSRELAGALLKLSLDQETSPVIQAVEAVKREIRIR